MKLFIFYIIILTSINLSAQESAIKKFFKLPSPEKCWVIAHPFIAKKTLRITDTSLKISLDMKKDSLLDGDANGGQVDAFRHSFWMALLSQNIRWRAVYKLGRAHEKSNKKDYKKHRNEDGALPDEPACHMDYLNNDIGIAIGREQDTISTDSLIQYIKQEIIAGKMFVLKKDIQGNYLDCSGNILKPEDYQGKWLNDKCIVRSNESRK